MAKEITINVRLNPCSLSSQFWTKDNPFEGLRASNKGNTVVILNGKRLYLVSTFNLSSYDRSKIRGKVYQFAQGIGERMYDEVSGRYYYRNVGPFIEVVCNAYNL